MFKPTFIGFIPNLSNTAANFGETTSPFLTTTLSSLITILPFSIAAGIPTLLSSPKNGPGGIPVEPFSTLMSHGAICPPFTGAGLLFSSNIL